MFGFSSPQGRPEAVLGAGSATAPTARLRILNAWSVKSKWTYLWNENVHQKKQTSKNRSQIPLETILFILTIEKTAKFTDLSPPTSHPLSCIGNRSERLMHTQKCRAFTRVIATHQLSKFKAGEMCPGVSLKKCKFHMPLLIWMQSDMTVAEFAQQRGNRYQVNTVYVHTDRRRKEVAAWIIHYETPHTSLMAGNEESSWSRSLFWDERSVC